MPRLKDPRALHCAHFRRRWQRPRSPTECKGREYRKEANATDYKIVAPVKKANCCESQQCKRRGDEKSALKVIRISHLLPHLAPRTSNALVNGRPCEAWASLLNDQLGWWQV